jgi:hypothetical protein
MESGGGRELPQPIVMDSEGNFLIVILGIYRFMPVKISLLEAMK